MVGGRDSLVTVWAAMPELCEVCGCVTPFVNVTRAKPDDLLAVAHFAQGGLSGLRSTEPAWWGKWKFQGNRVDLPRCHRRHGENVEPGIGRARGADGSRRVALKDKRSEE